LLLPPPDLAADLNSTDLDRTHLMAYLMAHIRGTVGRSWMTGRRLISGRRLVVGRS